MTVKILIFFGFYYRFALFWGKQVYPGSLYFDRLIYSSCFIHLSQLRGTDLRRPDACLEPSVLKLTIPVHPQPLIKKQINVKKWLETPEFYQKPLVWPFSKMLRGCFETVYEYLGGKFLHIFSFVSHVMCSLGQAAGSEVSYGDRAMHTTHYITNQNLATFLHLQVLNK